MKFISNKYGKINPFFILCSLLILLTRCDNLILMHPKGNIGLEERNLILLSFSLMLIVVIPVIIMTIVFSIKYRSSNINNTQYNPNWEQSKVIEFFIWIIPIIIITVLSIFTWKSTHKLDPKNPIISVTYDPIVIDVIALDWKWLFIYPKNNIATINELSFPVNVPVKFNVTSHSVMNSFFIPQLGSQIYAMAGMHTQLFLISNYPGKYQGISSNFSGSGFSGMKFTVIVTKNEKEFDQWIYKIKKSKNHITNTNEYEKLAKPSTFHPIIYFSNVQPNLFYEVLNKFVNKKQHCK